MINKVTRWISIFMILIITLFSLLLIGIKQENVLFDITESRFLQSLNIPLDDPINKDDFNSWIAIIKANNVYVSKTINNVKVYSFDSLHDDVGTILGMKISEETKLLTTQDLQKASTERIKTLPILNDYSKDYVSFSTFNYISVNESVSGKLMLHAQNENDIKDAIDVLNTLTNIDVSNQIANVTPSSDLQFFTTVLLIMFTFTGVVTIISIAFGVMKRSKDIAVMKMLGYSNFKICSKGIVRYIILYLAVSILSLLVPIFVFKSISNLLLQYQCGFLLIFLCISVLIILLSSLFVIRKFAISSLLKSQKTTGSILTLILIIKMISIATMIPFSIQTMPLLSKSINLKYQYESFRNYQEMYAFGTYAKDIVNELKKDGQGLMPGYPSLDNKEFYQNVVMPLNGYYADFSDYECNDDINQEDCENSTTKVAIVNDWYLNDYDLMNTQELQDFRNTNALKIYVPDVYKSKLDEIRQTIYEMYLDRDAVLSHQSVISFELYTEGKFYSMSTNVSTQDFSVIDPILIVFNEHSISYINKDSIFFFGRGASTPFQFVIPKGNTVEEIYEQVNTQLKTMMLDDNLTISHIANTSSDLFESLRNTTILLSVYSSVTIVLVLVVVYMTLNLTLMYFEDNKKEIAVKKSLGMSDTSIVREFFILVVTSSIVGILFYLIISAVRQTLDVHNLRLILIVSVIVLCLDIIIFKIVTHQFMNHKLLKQLKGG